MYLNSYPKDWKQIKLRQILRPFSEKNHPELSLLSVVREKGVIVRNIHDKEENHNFVPEDLSNYKRVKRGQFAMNKMKAWQGSYGISKYDGIVSPAYFVFDVDGDINLDFFNVAIRSQVYVSYFGQASDGIRVGQWDLSMQRMKEIPFLVPLRAEQDQIVRFLDWKVSAINRLIGIKRKQEALLKEQEQKIIARVTFKGLRNNLLKDSGNKWIKEIPAHWKITKLGTFCRFQNGISESGEFFSSGKPFVSYGDVYRHLELPQTVSGMAKSDEVQQEQFSVRCGDIFFTRTSENIEEIGMAAVCKQTIDKAVFSGFLIRCRPKNNIVDTDYMKYYLQTVAIRNHFSSTINIVTRASLGQSTLKEMPVIIPPMDEQKQIVSFLDSMHTKYVKLEGDIHREIDILSELKTRLIADTVTGIIDVRNIEIPEYEFVGEESQAEKEIDADGIENEK